MTIAIRILGALIAAITSITLLTHFAIPTQQLQDWLSFGFTGLPNTPRQVIEIFTNNFRVTAVPLVFAAFAYKYAGTRRIGDIILIFMIIFQASMIAIPLAGYQQKLLPYLQHLPFELLAIAIAAAFYTTHRYRKPKITSYLTIIGLLILLLAIGAIIETY